MSHEDLDAWLETSGLVADADFDLASPVEAEAALEDLARVRAAREEKAHQHKLMIERYDAWLARVDGRLAHDERRITERLERWALARIEADPKGPMTFDLPSGTVVTRKGSTVVEIEDEAAFIEAWTGYEYVGVKPPVPTIVKAKVKEDLQDGVVIDGASLVEKPRSVTIKTERADA